MNSEMLYCCIESITKQLSIRPVKYYFDKKSCSIIFPVRSNTVLHRILDENKFISFTVDDVNTIDPFKNRGLMIIGIVSSKLKKAEKTIHLERLVHKHTSLLREDDVQKLNNQGLSSIIVNIIKITSWEGPFFSTFICNQRIQLMS
jgi:hypothetical protein